MSLVSRIIATLLFILLIISTLSAYQRGKKAAELACSNARMQSVQQALIATVNTVNQLTSKAQHTSTSLSKQIEIRSIANAKTTQEIRHALRPDPAYTSCRFDTHIMQQLNAARDKANYAATGGINTVLPATGSTGRQ